MKYTIELRDYTKTHNKDFIKRLEFEEPYYFSFAILSSELANSKEPAIHNVLYQNNEFIIWLDNIPEGFTVDMEKGISVYFIKLMPIEAPCSPSEQVPV